MGRGDGETEVVDVAPKPREICGQHLGLTRSVVKLWDFLSDEGTLTLTVDFEGLIRYDTCDRAVPAGLTRAEGYVGTYLKEETTLARLVEDLTAKLRSIGWVWLCGEYV